MMWRDRWAEESLPFRFNSSHTWHANLKSYQRIRAMGERAVPFILREIQEGSVDWVWMSLLHEIVGESPVPTCDRGNYARMRERWLDWGNKWREIQVPRSN